jgi:hypothetical protein
MTIFTLLNRAAVRCQTAGGGVGGDSGYPAVMRLIAALLVLAAAGCERKEAEIDGVGEWRVGKTTRSAGVVCQDQEGGISWCSHNGTIAIGGQSGNVDLYFDGHTDDAPLAEILVTVLRCREQPIEQALIEQLGAPAERVKSALVWQRPLVNIVAMLPSEPDLCELSFLHPNQTERLDSLRRRAGR